MFLGLSRKVRLGFLMGCACLEACSSHRTLATQNYQVLAVLDGPQGRVVGSTVIKASTIAGRNLEDGRYKGTFIQGTGIPLRFPDGHYLFTTFYGEGSEYQHNWDGNYRLWDAKYDSVISNGRWAKVSDVMTPKIIGFRDITDPKTVYVIDNGYSKLGVDGYPSIRFFIRKTNMNVNDSIVGIIPWVKVVDNYLSEKNGAVPGNLEQNANIEWIYRGMKNGK